MLNFWYRATFTFITIICSGGAMGDFFPRNILFPLLHLRSPIIPNVLKLGQIWLFQQKMANFAHLCVFLYFFVWFDPLMTDSSWHQQWRAIADDPWQENIHAHNFFASLNFILPPPPKKIIIINLMLELPLIRPKKINCMSQSCRARLFFGAHLIQQNSSF